jgi:hypothetical protein
LPHFVLDYPIGRVTFLLINFALACSCGAGLKTKAMCFRPTILPGANADTPIAVDLVLLRDKDLLKEVPKLSAADWGRRREQYIRDYPDEKQLADYRWEWVPGQQVRCFTVHMAPKPKAAYLFVNYASKGDHRAKLPVDKGINLQLLADDFELKPSEACSAKDCPVSIQ